MTRYHLHPPYPTYRDNKSTLTHRMTWSHLENKERNPDQSQVSPLTPHPQIHLPEDPYQSQKEREVWPMKIWQI